MRSIKSDDIIDCLEDIFIAYGYPRSLKTDNGSNFVSKEFEGYLESYDIKHRKSMPLWPQANGEVERQKRTLLKALKIAYLNNSDVRKELRKFLLAYLSINTTHSKRQKSGRMYVR